jgi:hypothetical protein
MPEDRQDTSQQGSDLTPQLCRMARGAGPWGGAIGCLGRSLDQYAFPLRAGRGDILTNGRRDPRRPGSGRRGVYRGEWGRGWGAVAVAVAVAVAEGSDLNVTHRYA